LENLEIEFVKTFDFEIANIVVCGIKDTDAVPVGGVNDTSGLIEYFRQVLSSAKFCSDYRGIGD
jgi:hypothetical protein